MKFFQKENFGLDCGVECGLHSKNIVGVTRGLHSKNCIGLECGLHSKSSGVCNALFVGNLPRVSVAKSSRFAWLDWIAQILH